MTIHQNLGWEALNVLPVLWGSCCWNAIDAGHLSGYPCVLRVIVSRTHSADSFQCQRVLRGWVCLRRWLWSADKLIDLSDSDAWFCITSSSIAFVSVLTTFLRRMELCCGLHWSLFYSFGRRSGFVFNFACVLSLVY